ncbi:MAG TPA: hypothetical protein VK508_20255 [Cyclobacteriaceae bacterium]|nr:hypothetical protein [Cyclobacteriaceae bacterium]
MWTLRFWQQWPRDNRIFLLALFVVFAAALTQMWAAYFIEPSPAVYLQTIKEPELNEIPVDQFSKGPFDFTVKGNNYVILQRQLGSTLATSVGVAYTYLFTLAVFVIGMLAVISTLGRFYYLVGMGIFILFVTTLSPEVLGVMGQYNKTFTVTMMAFYCLPSFWLFYFGPTVSFIARIAVFTVVTVAIWAIIYFLSATEMPFLFLATYSAEAGLIACTLFIVTVSHEIIAGFIFAVTQSTRQGKSLNHFLIISMIYFLNLVLAYAVRFGFIKWDLITVDLFLLLTISAILGIWGIRQRQKTFEGVIEGDPYAVFAFLLMGVFTFATIAMFMFNANDTALSAISDIIIFSHLGFGFIFLTYIFSNFLGMLAQNFTVHKVLYSPNNMPYFTFRLAGLIVTLALVFYNAWQVPVHNAMSGYYNGIGDLYMKLNNDRLARAYYDESRTYGFRGHHSNYALANIEGALFNVSDERTFYAEASGRRPTEMSLLNWAQSYQSVNDNLGAVATLSDGVAKLENHKAIENTLGLLYARNGLPDSAIKYLESSGKSSPYKDIATANILGLQALNRISLPPDTTSQPGGDPVAIANRLAVLNMLGYPTNGSFALPADTVLTLQQAAGISNWLINQRNSEDTTFVRKIVSLARKPSNSGFKEPLLFAAAISLYNSGETKEGFMMLEEVTVGSELQGKYNNILTVWSIENDEPQRALGYADYAVSQRYAPAQLTYAVALTENLPAGGNEQLRNTITAWDSLRTGGDTITNALANRIRRALLQPSASLSDEDKYVYARYRLSAADSNTFFDLVPTVQDDNVKAKILLDLAQKFHSMDKPRAALRSLQRVAGLELTDPAIGPRMQLLEMLSRVRMGQTSIVLQALQQYPVGFKGKEKKYKVYFDALAAQAAGDSTNANKYFHWLGEANPYFEDGLIAAAEYFQKKGDTSYNLIAEGLLYHPSSIRIRKAYTLESARQGFEGYSRNALASLKPLIGARDHAELTRQVDTLLAVER